MYSLGDYIQAVDAYLPQALMTQTDRERLQQAMSALPAQLFETLVFETRLAEMDSPVDIAVSVPRQSRTLLAETGTYAGLPAHPIWEQIKHFAQGWSDPESPLYQTIKAIWFEFDMPQDEPIPVLFIDIAERVKSIADYPFVRDVALPLLTGCPVPSATAQLQEKCIRLLPEQRTLYGFGSFLVRGSTAQRILVDSLGYQGVIPYLQQIGWQGDTALVEQAILWAQACDGHILLDLDMDETIHSKIGIEVGLKTQAQQAAFVDYLIKAGLCLPEKGAAVPRFANVSSSYSDPNHPRPYVEAVNALQGVYASRLRFDISHIKIVCKPEGVLEAKAYLRVSHRWVSPADR